MAFVPNMSASLFRVSLYYAKINKDGGMSEKLTRRLFLHAREVGYQLRIQLVGWSAPWFFRDTMDDMLAFVEFQPYKPGAFDGLEPWKASTAPDAAETIPRGCLVP
jgi:hypothetical protein